MASYDLGRGEGNDLFQTLLLLVSRCAGKRPHSLCCAGGCVMAQLHLRLHYKVRFGLSNF